MTEGLAFYGTLGVISTVLAFYWNRRLFIRAMAGNMTWLEGTFYVIGLASLVLGWYFNVRYVHAHGSHATYWNYIKALFNSWASDSAAQDYTIANVVLLPLWTIFDGRRRNLKTPWIFFVMSLFTSFAFAMAWYLAFIERQIRFNDREATASTAGVTIGS